MGNVSLFSFLFGDNITAINKDLAANGLGRVFAYLFSMTFIMLFLLGYSNIMVSIFMEEFKYFKEAKEEEEKLNQQN
jgi:hypothetical protein